MLISNHFCPTLAISGRRNSRSLSSKINSNCSPNMKETRFLLNNMLFLLCNILKRQFAQNSVLTESESEFSFSSRICFPFDSNVNHSMHCFLRFHWPRFQNLIGKLLTTNNRNHFLLMRNYDHALVWMWQIASLITHQINNIRDRMKKQLLNSVIAKLSDLSESGRSINCLSPRLWQTIDLHCTNSSTDISHYIFLNLVQ